MAEEKKPAKGGDKGGDKKPPGWNLDMVESLIVLLIVIALISTLVPLARHFFGSTELSFFGLKFSSIGGFFARSAWFFKMLGFGIAGASAIATFVFNKKADAIWRAEKARLYPKEMPVGEASAVTVPHPTASKWAQIVEKSESTDENNWRIAIIEADIILDSLLEKLNLPGQTIGEKLKAVEPSDFLTLDNAWEAHKARNLIAHEGANFLLNQREVRRIISLYESVFKEFHLI